MRLTAGKRGCSAHIACGTPGTTHGPLANGMMLKRKYEAESEKPFGSSTEADRPLMKPKLGLATPVEDGRQGQIRIRLKYGAGGESVLHKLSRESKPGCRQYSGVEALPRPLQGLGIAIVSTSKGVISDRKAREERVGGELLCTIE